MFIVLGNVLKLFVAECTVEGAESIGYLVLDCSFTRHSVLFLVVVVGKLRRRQGERSTSRALR